MATAEKVTHDEVVSRQTRLVNLIKTCRDLAKDLGSLAASLNTAPVTLSALAKECRTVTSVLNRFKLFCSTYSVAIQADARLLDDFHHGPIRELLVATSELQVSVQRLRPTDATGDSSQLIIVWNEGSLKLLLQQLGANRSSLEFLVNSPRSAVFRVCDYPGVRSALGGLRPDPDITYTPSAKLSGQLHEAIDRGDEATVLSLLLRRVDPNAPRPGSTTTPLTRAFDRGSSSIATFLAIAGANLHPHDSNGENALIRGVKSSFPDTFIALLCELGACIDAVDASGSSALHHAAGSKKEDDTISILIHAGADINMRDHAGRTPLIVAVEKASMRAVDVLTEYEADMEVRLPNRGTALHIAVAKGQYMLAEKLADRGARIDSRIRDHTTLTLAISTASSEIAAMLIEAGADVDVTATNGTTPLLAATAIGDAHVTELLLAQGARVDVANSQGYYPIHMAAHKNKVEILQLLIGAGSPIDSVTQRNETPLSIAVEFGYPRVVQHLIQAGANLDEPPPGRSRAIFAALKSRNIDVCLTLVRGGADCTSPMDESRTVTPIHLAAELGLDAVVAAMIAAGANMEATTWQGYTPLYAATENGHPSTVRLLLKRGASVRARSASGGNVLFVATRHPAILKRLIGLRIDVNERDHYGASPLHYAALWGHAAGAKVLLQKGAKLTHANSVFETMADFREGTTYRQGTPAGLARQKGHVQISKMIDRWKVKG
ncbi:hypothetical protein ACRALDRAFT_2042593 [Sodiomyces alcalophilus JCM 7366]|uniref:uncharacterized protein n=1 Tax=Sodiomyces alcalophilus JCM 7366 TaxID=591952 RepID=UPI0039B44085